MSSSALWRISVSSSLERSSHCSDCVENGKCQSLRRDSEESFPCSVGEGGSSESDGRYGGGGDNLIWEEARRVLAGGRGRGVMEPASIRMRNEQGDYMSLGITALEGSKRSVGQVGRAKRASD